MNLAAVDPIVNALLYEGYILYPYRASSIKNRLRFNFGVVYPRSFAEAQSGSDAWSMQTQCLATGAAEAAVEICVRFLHLVKDGLEASWQQVKECRVDLPATTLQELLTGPVHHDFAEELISGRVEVCAQDLGEATRVSVRIVNTARIKSDSREQALPYSMISTHTILELKNGEFVSLLDPPERLKDAAAGCHSSGTWPVLVGPAGERQMLLSSPIILYDYPAIALESPGDLFDGTEIDEILTLRVLTLADWEKQEARLTDDRARRILERAENMSEDALSRLHGVFRAEGDEP